jgi:hypothetical protein
MKRQIKNTTQGGLGIGGTPPFWFAPGVVTEVDDADLQRFLKDPIVKSWFDDGKLVEQTPAAQVAAKVVEAKPEAKTETKVETKKDDGKK